MKSGGTGRVDASSLEVVADGAPIGFDLPYAEELSSPQLGTHIWQMIQWAFALPELELRLDVGRLDGDLLATLNRFTSKASELAASPYLGFETELEIEVRNGAELIRTNFPHRESTTGFLVMFRQFFDQGESASYANVHAGLRCAAEAQELHDDVARLDRWGTVHTKLRRRPPKTWVAIKHLYDCLVDSDHRDGLRAVPYYHQPRIAKLIEIYLYGDLVHYGKRKDELRKIEADQFEAATHEMTLHHGVAGLSMFYLGIAESVRRLLRPNNAPAAKDPMPPSAPSK